MNHPYMKEYKILNGVSTLEENFEYIIRINNRDGDGIFGTTSNKTEALKIVERVGKDELKLLRKTTDPIWTVTDGKFDEEKMTYTVTKQTLGRITNGPVKVFSQVYIETVPRLYTSEYIREVIVDGPYKTVADELKHHPKIKDLVDTSKDNDY